MSSGRIQLNKTEKINDYPLYGKSSDSSVQTSSVEDAMLKGNIESNPLSKLFFSDTNIAALQQGMRNMILNKTNGEYKIGNQSQDELLTVMRAIYFDKAKNLPYDVVNQVKQLNQCVLAYTVPRIIDEVKMYQTYLNDISSGPQFFDRPESTSVAGTKVLEIKKY
jgi:hypothetical protein